MRSLILTRIVNSFRLVSICFLLFAFNQNTLAEIVSVMTYNAENLFDNEHDEGKEDYTYLPLSVKKRSSEVRAYCRGISNYYYRKQCFELDWSDAALNKKLENLARVIKGYNRGFGPDILLLQEVENINVLRMLNRHLDFETLVLIEGEDKRGIDTAILSRFPLTRSPKLHPLKIKTSSGRVIKTRGILEARFAVHGHDLTILNNHWPSQAAPDEFREQAARQLRELTNELGQDLVIAGGDFNTNSDDAPHGVNKWLLDFKFDPTFYDSFEMSPYSPGELDAPGTHSYEKNWEFLDRILVWSGYEKVFGLSPLRPLWSKYEVIFEPWMGEDEGGELVPKRFDPETGEGVSDHLPVVMKFFINS